MTEALAHNEARVNASHNKSWQYVIAAQAMGTGKTALGAAFAHSPTMREKNLAYVYVNFER